MPLDEVLQRCGDKKIFLAQAQLPPGGGLVARIEDLGERLGARLLAQRADMVAAVEDLETYRVDGARRPQPQWVDVRPAPADDRRIVGNRLDGFGGMPDKALMPAAPRDDLDRSAVVDVVGDF